jgi:hypothetical protein
MNILRNTLNVVFLAAGLSASAQNNSNGKIHIGLVYPLSSNGTHAPLDTNKFSLNLIAGVSAAENGTSFSGLTTIVRGNTSGLQVSGFSNHIGKQAGGAQFAGFLNTYGSGDGFAIAGFSNLSFGHVKGVQISGFANLAKDVQGIQIGGFMNKAGDLGGSQLAGFLNIAKSVSATQVAGFMNSAKDVKGSQIAGFINIARKVKGAQIAGFINVADSSDFPIGIINLVKNGEKSIALTTDENLTTMVTFRSGGKKMYGIIGLGYNFENTEAVYAFEVGLGAHFFQSNTFRVNAELAAGSLENFKKGDYFKSSLRILPAFKISPHIEIFGGPELNFINTDSYEGRSLTKKYIKSWESKWGNNLNALYLGYTGGVQFIF